MKFKAPNGIGRYSPIHSDITEVLSRRRYEILT